MNRINDHEETMKLRQVKWKTNLSRQLSEFSEIIKDDEVFEKYFGEKYVEKLTAKSKSLSQTITKLGMFYSALMISLFASQNIGEFEFQVFGYGFKNLGRFKELALLLAAVISPISAVLTAYRNYLTALTKECLKKISPNVNIRRFYSYLFLDEHLDGLIGKIDFTSARWHGFAMFLILAFGIIIIFLCLALIAASFFIQINVIYDVAINPVSSKYVNLFVIIFSTASIVLTWLIAILQFPTPEVDLSNYSRLSKIKEEDPKKYQEIMTNLSKESAQKEARSTIVISAIVYIVAFAGIAMYWFPDSLDRLSSFLGKAVPGTFIITFCSNELVKHIRKRCLSWFFHKYPDESDQRLRIFGIMGKSLVLTKIAIPLLLSVGYSVFVF